MRAQDNLLLDKKTFRVVLVQFLVSSVSFLVEDMLSSI